MMKRAFLTTAVFLVLCLSFAKQPQAIHGDEPYELVEHTMDVNGATRRYLLYFPSAYDGKIELPLLMVFHGAYGSMAGMAENRTDLLALAQEKNFILVFPHGQNSTDQVKDRAGWKAVHCCPPAIEGQLDDVAFIRQLAATLQNELAVDPRRIHATGFSNGAMFTHRLAADLPYLFASVAPVAGTIGGRKDVQEPVNRVEPGAAVPIMLIHGTADQVVLYEGGQPYAPNWRSDLSFAESVTLWVQTNNSGPLSRETLPGALGNIHRDTYPGGEQGADVTAVTIENLKHKWPTTESVGVDISRDIFEFFETHPRRIQPFFIPVVRTH